MAADDAPPAPPAARAPSPIDAVLLDGAQRGDRAAWGWMYRRYSRLVHAVLITRVPHHDAEDLVQDVFAKAMGSISGVRDPASLGSWLATVARNRATDFLRQRRRRRATPLDECPEPAPASAPQRDHDLEADAVLEAIRQLPEAYRETIAMRLVEGLTGPQIAERLGMTHGSVRVNLHRGMALLREALGMETRP